MSRDWDRIEVEAVVALYLEMFQMELRRESYSKAEFNRKARLSLPTRSRGSIEFKHQNISAVLLQLGYPYISGYKPRRNYQELLRQVVTERVAGNFKLERTARDAVDSEMTSPSLPADFHAIVVPAPLPEKAAVGIQEVQDSNQSPVTRHTNFLEREARNRSLGLAGERFAMQFEHERLWRDGRRDLAERIEHVSESRGDGLGYDILSYEINGQERLIEVKTTAFGERTPFFMSRNELVVSREEADAYRLYRLFDFREKPRMFQLAGDISRSCDLEPVTFRVSI